MTSVAIFNACSDEIILEINGGPQLHVPPTGETSGWIPQQPDDLVGWSARDQTPAQFHYGTNKIRMYRPGQDRTKAQEPAIEISDSGSAVTSLQFYLFWHSGHDLAWIFMRDGCPTDLSRTFGNLLPPI